ncbi:MAG TPA: hypothetical protein VI548_00275 [Chitinophagaceae bacterium]|nr:hypothetical protein [Chitinophagaceae bacterium]
MEVHHHSHTARRKWTHYFWEFLMLFLAVTLGFFVENQREHYIEKQRAKEFAQSLTSDLKLDIINLTDMILVYDSVIKNTETFIQLVDSFPGGEVPGGTLYYYGNFVNMNYRMAFYTATIEQLKSSGSLRYFPLNLRNKISSYDQNIQEYNLRQGNEPVYNIETRKYYEKIFDQAVLKRFEKTGNADTLFKLSQTNFPLLMDDKLLLKQFANNCYGRKEAWRNRTKFMLIPIKKMAEDLVKLLAKEYHFK